MHQMAYRIYHGQLPENTEIDHKDRNKDNVTKDNLRAVTRSVNGANKGKSKLNQSGRTGVSYRVSKYTRNGKTYEYQYWNARVKKDKKLVLCKDFPYTTDGLIQAAREVNRQYAIHFPEVAAPNVGVEINDN